jgi:hypothetical protein
MEKKLKAKSEMLKMLSKMMSDDMYSGMGDELKSKKMSKVTVAAPDAEGLKKGLSKAQEIIAAKMGKGEMKDEYDMEDEYACEKCEGKGCPMCEESEEEESDEE